MARLCVDGTVSMAKPPILHQSPTAAQFVKQLTALGSAKRAQDIRRYFKQSGDDDVFVGVPMGQVFALAKAFVHMPLDEIERLLESEIHEARVGAVSIMDFLARHKQTPDARRKELYELYLRRHDRINNWDLVDRSAQYVVGGFLFDKPRKVLYKLARSKNLWERRTAMIATAYFMRHKQVEDTFKIATLLLKDNEDLSHKATGWMLRVAGDVDRSQLLAFLDVHADTMPRVMLRYAIEKLDKKQREHYLGLRKAA
jgi:3-methyladenine DNA glycosylase AlkD